MLKSLHDITLFSAPVIVKYIEQNLNVTKSRYSKQNLTSPLAHR